MDNWTNSYEYIRILEILEDYWTTQPDELKVRVRMDFVKANGEYQQKEIVWHNPNYRYVGPVKNPIRSLADIKPANLRGEDPEFWSVKNYEKKN